MKCTRNKHISHLINQIINIFSFDWLKDGAILANKLLQYALRIEQSPDGFTQRLIFECAQFDHIGVYRCVATDVNGNQIWTEARLGVIGKLI